MAVGSVNKNTFYCAICQKQIRGVRFCGGLNILDVPLTNLLFCDCTMSAISLYAFLPLSALTLVGQQK